MICNCLCPYINETLYSPGLFISIFYIHRSLILKPLIMTPAYCSLYLSKSLEKTKLSFPLPCTNTEQINICYQAMW